MKNFFIALSLIWGIATNDARAQLPPKKKLGYAMTRDGVPHPTRTFFKKNFKKHLVGHGWKCEEHYPIEADGSLGWLNDQRGRIPYAIGNDYLYWGEKTMTFYSRYRIGCDIPIYLTYKYTYIPKEKRVEAQTTHIINGVERVFTNDLELLSYDSHKHIFYAIKHVGTKKDLLYYLCVYQRMAEKELQKRRKEHIYTLEQAKIRKREIVDSMKNVPPKIKVSRKSP